MFRPKPMSRLLIAASKDQLESVIKTLYRHRVFHIEEYVEEKEEAYEGFRIGMPLSGATELSSGLIKIRSIENVFGIRSEDVYPSLIQKSDQLWKLVESELPSIASEVETLVSQKTKLENTQREYEQKIGELEIFTALPHDLALLRDYDHFIVFAGHIPHDIELPVPCEKFFSDKVPGNLFVTIVPSTHREETERLLLDAHFQAVSIPGEEGSAAERVAWYSDEISRINSEIEQIRARIEEQRQRHTEFMVACDELLTAEVERAEVPLRFATTDQMFVAEGWVPTDYVDQLKTDLLSATGGKIFFTELEVDYEKESVPVEYDNPSFAKPSELLMDVYARPRYREIDPTVMLTIVFPLFFGLILGDIGYGALLVLMSFGLRKFMKGEEGQKLLDVLRNASISSIIFGVLFSEFFGFALPWKPLIFSRHVSLGGHGGHGPQVAELLILSTWIAILHLTLGRIIGIVNAKSMYHGKHATKAMIANVGWLGFMWGLLIMIWSMVEMPLMPNLTGFPAIVMGFSGTALFGAVLLVAGVISIAQENALELVELPTLISHTMSYARLVAVGLSSVAIASVVNLLSIGMMIEPQLEAPSVVGIVFIIAGIVVFLIGHLLNTALGLLGGGLHSIRLHYVEFFTKFYKGGAQKYIPLGMKRRFTED